MAIKSITTMREISVIYKDLCDKFRKLLSDTSIPADTTISSLNGLMLELYSSIVASREIDSKLSAAVVYDDTNKVNGFATLLDEGEESYLVVSFPGNVPDLIWDCKNPTKLGFVPTHVSRMMLEKIQNIEGNKK